LFPGAKIRVIRQISYIFVPVPPSARFLGVFHYPSPGAARPLAEVDAREVDFPWAGGGGEGDEEHILSVRNRFFRFRMKNFIQSLAM